MNSVLAAIEPKASFFGLHVGFSVKDFSMQLNGPFLNCIVRGVIGEKIYRAVGMVRSIVGYYIDRATTGFQNV